MEGLEEALHPVHRRRSANGLSAQGRGSMAYWLTVITMLDVCSPVMTRMVIGAR